MQYFTQNHLKVYSLVIKCHFLLVVSIVIVSNKILMNFERVNLVNRKKDNESDLKFLAFLLNPNYQVC